MAAPPPPPPSAPWAVLPVNAMREIITRIPCGVDRSRMWFVCRGWRTAIAEVQRQPEPQRPLPPPLPLPLPWLLLPEPEFGSTSTRAACVLSDCRVHHLTITPRGARCFGSQAGAWLFLDFPQPRGNQIVNFRTGVARLLPGALVRETVGRVESMAMLAATLSSPPDDPSCVGAAIVESWPWLDPDPDPASRPLHRGVALWRMGSTLAMEAWPSRWDERSWNVDDIVHHDGAFHMLTSAGHIIVCEPNVRPRLELRQFQPIRGIDQDCVYNRYLVESRGELLMVIKMSHRNDERITSAFKVFGMAERRRMADPDSDINDPLSAAYPWSWRELHTLGGRLLFVGHACSKSYEMDEYTGFKEDIIYFFDDEDFYCPGQIARNKYVRKFQYRCSDNGRWSQGRVQRCFPAPDPSEQSPPAWFLH